MDTKTSYKNWDCAIDTRTSSNTMYDADIDTGTYSNTIQDDVIDTTISPYKI